MINERRFCHLKFDQSNGQNGQNVKKWPKKLQNIIKNIMKISSLYTNCGPGPLNFRIHASNNQQNGPNAVKLVFHRYQFTDTDTDTDTRQRFIPIPIPIPDLWFRPIPIPIPILPRSYRYRYRYRYLVSVSVWYRYWYRYQVYLHVMCLVLVPYRDWTLSQCRVFWCFVRCPLRFT